MPMMATPVTSTCARSYASFCFVYSHRCVTERQCNPMPCNARPIAHRISWQRSVEPRTRAPCGGFCAWRVCVQKCAARRTCSLRTPHTPTRRKTIDAAQRCLSVCSIASTLQNSCKIRVRLDFYLTFVVCMAVLCNCFPTKRAATSIRTTRSLTGYTATWS